MNQNGDDDTPKELPPESSNLPDAGNVLPREVLEALPDDLRITAIKAVSSFQGPIPPPEMLARYEEISPGTAKLLLDMAVKEQDHRIDWDKEILSISRETARRGQWLGFFMWIAGILTAGFLAFNGAMTVGGVVAAASFLGFVKPFLDFMKGR